jgi:resuscitation-promoting factor RpfA
MGAHSHTGPRHARPRGPRHAKPAPPSMAHRTAAATGVAAALMAGETLGLGGTASAVSPDTWAALRMCESSGNYGINTGNGYYGAYQFLWSTYRSVGGRHRPDLDVPREQSYRAWRVWRRDGESWREWGTAGVCGLR